MRCFGEERAFISVINRRQRVWLGHTPQHGDLIPSVIYEGKKIGMRSLARPRMGMLDRVKDGSSYVAFKGSALDQEPSGRTCL